MQFYNDFFAMISKERTINKVFPGAVLVGLISVAGCAVTPEGEAYMKYRAAQDAGQEALAGSRLIKLTTERMVGAVGNK